MLFHWISKGKIYCIEFREQAPKFFDPLLSTQIPLTREAPNSRQASVLQEIKKNNSFVMPQSFSKLYNSFERERERERDRQTETETEREREREIYLRTKQ